MNRVLVRQQQARAEREKVFRFIKAVALFRYARQRMKLLRLLVAMTWCKGFLWQVRMVCIYRAAWREWVSILKRLADKADADRLLEQDRAEGARLAELMRFEGDQAIRKAKGRTPSYLARMERRRAKGVQYNWNGGNPLNWGPA